MCLFVVCMYVCRYPCACLFLCCMYACVCMESMCASKPVQEMCMFYMFAHAQLLLFVCLFVCNCMSVLMLYKCVGVNINVEVCGYREKVL